MRRSVRLLLPLLVMAGCASRPPSTPDGVVEGFNHAMAAQDLDAALRFLDLEAWARQANSDWDSFPSSQRNLIVDKVSADVRAQVGRLKWPAEGFVFSPARASADQATAVGTSVGTSLTLSLSRSGAGWRITGGLPGVSVSGD